MTPAPVNVSRGRWRRVATGLLGLSVVAYPVLVYGVLQKANVRLASFVLLLAVLPLVGSVIAQRRANHHQAVPRGNESSSRPGKRMTRPSAAAWAAAVVVALITVAGSLESMRALLFVPVAVNASFLVGFGHTLLSGPPLIERLARLQHPDLTTAEARWCRHWTVAWCCFFALNIGVAAMLASTGRLAWWTIYNGLISYVLMGLLFSAEYVLRKYRFRRMTKRPWDRLLQITFDRLSKPALQNDSDSPRAPTPTQSQGTRD